MADTLLHCFDRVGPALPRSPVVIAIPHAGRDYPPELIQLARVPRATLAALEDRHADLLAADALRLGASALVARAPRAWIDLNRDERDLDPAMVAETPATPPVDSLRIRSGLGLIPRRLIGTGELWRRRFTRGEVTKRIRGCHRPYHQALSAMLAAAADRFGVAVLLDLHSMPPLGRAPGAVQVVIGDHHGASAGRRFTDAALRGLGTVRASVNLPYAGGYTLVRHGAPARAVHALQLEVDRSLYLDSALEQPGPGLGGVRAMVADVVARLANEALAGSLPIAAE